MDRPLHPGLLDPPVVVLTGAGLSTASGIPDFRGPDGLWSTFDPMEFTIERFHADPAMFWARRAEYITAARHLDALPNEGHLALAKAARDGRVACILTQNVDGLHLKAGTPADKLVEVHGNGLWARCLGCGEREGILAVLERVRGDAPPRCACGGLLKPDVVLFGEEVTLIDRAIEAVLQARTMVVAGTSLQVHPVAGLVTMAAARGARLLLLNRDPTHMDHLAHLVARGPLQEELPRLFP